MDQFATAATTADLEPIAKLIAPFGWRIEINIAKSADWVALDHDMAILVKTLLRERPDRCVWGTNWPHPGLTKFMPNDADLVDQLDGWLPDDRVRQKLFVENPERLYFSEI